MLKSCRCIYAVLKFGLHRALLTALVVCCSGTLLASATRHDFEQCDKLAVAYLKSCLAENEDNCWQRSKSSYQSCRSKVTRKYADIRRQSAINKTLEIEAAKIK